MMMVPTSQKHQVGSSRLSLNKQQPRPQDFGTQMATNWAVDYLNQVPELNSNMLESSRAANSLYGMNF